MEGFKPKFKHPPPTLLTTYIESTHATTKKPLNKYSQAASLNSKEQQLFQQKEEITLQLKQLTLMKAAEVASAQARRTPLIEEINCLQPKLLKLQATHTSHSQAQESAHQVRLQVHEESLAALTKQAQIASDNLKQLTFKKEEFASALSTVQNRLKMSAEEINSRCAQRAEYIGEREETEELLRTLHPEALRGVNTGLMKAK